MSLRIITIDGPAGVGKTSLAKLLADYLQLPYLDTGAMFRCLALKLGPEAPELEPEELEAKSKAWDFSLSGQGADTSLLCNGVPVGNEIRTEEVAAMASNLGTVPIVREILKKAQRSLGHNTSLVAEGRDMGSVIFPEATHKFFLEASAEIRALRRKLQLEENGEKVDLELLTEQIRKRDFTDRNRAVAPLAPAPDAIIVDTSNLDLNGVLKLLLQHITIA